MSDGAISTFSSTQVVAPPTPADESKLGLTVFLIKTDQVGQVEQRLVTAQALPLIAPLDGVFVPIVASDGNEPSWVSEVRTIVSGTLPPMTSKSPGGFLIVRRSGQMFVITFGHAWQKIQDEWYEREFGRRVALNSIKPDQVVALHIEQVFAKWHLASERAPKASAVREFGVKFDRDLVGVIEGLSSNSSFGLSIRGGTNLHLKIALSELNSALDDAFSQFQSDRYKKLWPEIDNLAPVRDETLRATLDAQLDIDFANGSAEAKLIMFTPMSRRGESIEVESYVFGRMTKSPTSRPYLSVSSWMTYLEEQQKLPSTEEAKRSPIHLMDVAKEEIRKCTAYECFGYELALQGKQFILSSGLWYEVVPGFLSRTNAAVRGIDPPTSTLPAWDQVESEGEYNLRCSQSSRLLFFDAKKIFFGGGQSQFEFCDLFSPRAKTLFFAKIASRSSGMSHLVEQVRRTAELLFSTDPAYRRELSKVFKKYHPDADRTWLDSRPKNGDWQLCLVSLGRPKEKLPFFAKCGLARLYKDLSEAGHDVRFLNV